MGKRAQKFQQYRQSQASWSTGYGGAVLPKVWPYLYHNDLCNSDTPQPVFQSPAVPESVRPSRPLLPRRGLDKRTRSGSGLAEARLIPGLRILHLVTLPFYD